MSLVMDFWKRQLEAEQMNLDKLNKDYIKYNNFWHFCMNETDLVGDDNFLRMPPIECNEIFDDFLFEQQNNTGIWRRVTSERSWRKSNTPNYL